MKPSFWNIKNHRTAQTARLYYNGQSDFEEMLIEIRMWVGGL